ncbi:hypothetical protein Btru_046502 [Bulinus truncatus]|nr:hypothetical protein Btru_046502 [Bulinus truncatus]
MSALLPRSRSECTIKVKLPNSTHVQSGANKGSCGLSVSSPELRSMLIYLNTTVPQNLRPETLSTSHRPSSRFRYRLVKLPNSTHVQSGANNGSCGLSVSSPELRSMLIYLNTTVPQNLRPETLSTSHRPRSRFRYRLIALGAMITGVSAYVHIMIPAIRLREKPLWAGVPVSGTCDGMYKLILTMVLLNMR